MMTSWVYIVSERWTDDDGNTHNLYTVGFYAPDGVWHGDSDHATRKEAAARVHYLNGGDPA